MTSAKYHAKYDLHPLGYGGFFNVFLSGMSAFAPVAARADAGDSQRHGDIAVCGTGVLATMHGYSLKDVEDKLGKSKSLFGRFLLLTFKDRKRSVRIYDGEKHLLQETVL